MSKFAIIKIAGKQYQVSEGDEIVVDRLADEKGKSVVFDEVLLMVDGEKIQVGQPLVKGVKVKATIIDELKGEKIRIAIYKSKTRYRKVKGFRAQQTKLKIQKISVSASK
jgi:large subunit ribosomal protein L21